MFYVPGWISLKKLLNDRLRENEKFTDWEEIKKISDPNEWNEAYALEVKSNVESAYMDVWWIAGECADEGKAAVLTPSGSPVHIDSSALDFNEVVEPKGIHVDLRVGTLGSGSFVAKHEAARPAETRFDTLDLLYGPFRLCPVVLEKSCVANAFSPEGRATARVKPHEEVVRQIIEAFDADEHVTKPWAKETFGGGMKFVEFQVTWELAAKQRPELSRPGPRGPRV